MGRDTVRADLRFVGLKNSANYTPCFVGLSTTLGIRWEGRNVGKTSFLG